MALFTDDLRILALSEEKDLFPSKEAILPRGAPWNLREVPLGEETLGFLFVQ